MTNPYTLTGPSHLALAYSLIGTKEIPGPKNSPVIMNWALRIGQKVIGWKYPGDATPWCGLFAAYCVMEAGLKPPAGPLRALSWKDWGVPVLAGDLEPGDVLVFVRDGGGHVGFYIGEDATTYSVIGGNQGDAVSITRIAKARCVARRRAPGVRFLAKAPKIVATGAVSTNEA